MEVRKPRALPMLGDLLRTSATASPLNQHFSGDGAIIFRHTCALGYEGIV
jgi:hypothetical protein